MRARPVRRACALCAPCVRALCAVCGSPVAPCVRTLCAVRGSDGFMPAARIRVEVVGHHVVREPFKWPFAVYRIVSEERGCDALYVLRRWHEVRMLLESLCATEGLKMSR
jgi:hypothetical protein|eukprot:7355225-Prymnesium_polylepis.2